MLLIAGGYEGGLVGLKVKKSNKNEKKDSSEKNPAFIIERVFRFICSQGSIKCMATGLDFLLCGGTDETVQVYNLRNSKKHGEVMLPLGIITSVAGVGNLKDGTVIIGNEHGDISLYSSSDLTLLKVLKGHKGQISGISVDPSGKVIVSTALDASLRLWDLASQLCVFYTRLGEPPIDVAWSSTGGNYLLLTETRIMKCPTDEGVDVVTYNVEGSDKYLCCCWTCVDQPCIVAGTRGGHLVAYHGDKTSKVRISNHRVKSLVCLGNEYIVCGDSNGNLSCSKVTYHDDLLTIESQWNTNVEMRINVLATWCQ